MHRRALSRTAGLPSVRVAFLASLCFALCACGDNTSDELKSADTYQARCVMPRSGTDALGNSFIDVQGTVEDEKRWVRSWIDDTYLWYSEVPDIDLSKYATQVDVFEQAKTFAITPSGKPKDNYHSTRDTAEWIASSQSGVEAGYGLQWALLASKPPRSLTIAYTQPASPAAAANLSRGARILAIDGVDLVNGSDVDTLNAGLYPATLNESHTFLVQDLGSTTSRSVTLTSTTITVVPVQHVITIPQGAAKVGYFLFTDHLANAEKGLVEAITQLKSAGIADLIIDMRYNGGGYLAIASELAFMIAGPDRTAGKTFEELSFNDKHPKTDPVTNRALTPSPFLSKTTGQFSIRDIQDLPHLDLPRVFVLTTKNTCSASESVINSLAGVDVDVIQIGQTTCGKPYGFYPTDNCGTTFFAIQFKGVNNKGFGDYADGFTPAGNLPKSDSRPSGCVVSDDFSHVLGDPAEGLIAAALSYRANGTCPRAATARAVTTQETGSVLLNKPFWLQNRIVLR